MSLFFIKKVAIFFIKKVAEFIFSMYIAYHDVKAWKFSRCGIAGNRLVNVGNGTNINILPSITIYIGRQNR